ncbi:hypothetical protein [Amycolatopsis plumensis]|uniref:Uncharacterized protein n=1 Tax=Amycolatopsis plumensis TaxID=236508 RepID=A0ABV5ULY5_9PSEU
MPRLPGSGWWSPGTQSSIAIAVRRRDFVKNGDVWTVTAIRASGKMTVQHRVHKVAITLPVGYVQAHVKLAYPPPSTGAQGVTCTGTARLMLPRQVALTW